MHRFGGWFHLAVAFCLLAVAGCSIQDFADAFADAAENDWLDGLIPTGDDSSPTPNPGADDDANEGDDDNPGSGPGQAQVDDDDDDDDDNDDNDDDNDDNDDDNDDNDDDDTPLAVRVELIDGGLPGLDGTSVARLSSGVLAVAAAKEGWLYLYTVQNQTVSMKELAEQARSPSLVADVQDALHVAYLLDGVEKRVIYGTNANGGWEFTDVDAAESAAVRPALAVDADRQAHLTYVDGDGRQTYATNAGGDWHTATLDDSGTFGPFSGIAFDAGGGPHIAYNRGTGLYHAEKSSDAWRTEIVATSARLETYHPLAIAADGRIGIAYRYTGPDTAPYWAWRDGSLWQSERIDEASGRGYYVSLAADEAGDFHAAYYDNGADQLLHAVRREGVWDVETVGGGRLYGEQTHLLAAAERLYLSFYSLDGLQLATYDGAAWTVAHLDGDGVVGLYASLALDRDGGPQIAYYDYSNKRLKLARLAGNRWTIETVIADGDTGYYPSLAVDDEGFAHVAFYDRAAGDLVYATNLLGGWIGLTIDADGDVGLNPSLALDGDGRVHIAYRDHSHAALKYATNAAGDWRIEFVDAGGDAGDFSALAVDDAGRVRLAYHDAAFSRLRYATGGFGAWVFDTIDGESDPGWYVDLSAAASGAVQAVYATGLDGWLRYAYKPSEFAAWQVVTIGEGGNFYYPSLAADRQGAAHLTYYSGDPAQTDYVWGDPAAGWTGWVLDTGSSVSGRTSFALDRAGWGHAAYAGSASLRYALFPLGTVGR